MPSRKRASSLSKAGRPEILRAFRPVDDTKWVDEFSFRAWELVGNALDFEGVDNRKINVMGLTEMLRIFDDIDHDNQQPMKVIAKRARREAGDSWQVSTDATTLKVFIHEDTLASGAINRVLAVRLACPTMNTERTGLMRGVELEVGRSLPWNVLYTPAIKIAVIGEDYLIPRSQLDELSDYAQGDEVSLLPGVVERVPIEDGMTS